MWTNEVALGIEIHAFDLVETGVNVKMVNVNVALVGKVPRVILMSMNVLRVSMSASMFAATQLVATFVAADMAIYFMQIRKAVLGMELFVFRLVKMEAFVGKVFADAQLVGRDARVIQILMNVEMDHINVNKFALI